MQRILVVDDEEPVRLMLRMTLEDAGYDVEEVDDGARVVEKLRGNEFSLIITDLVMPEKEGIETIMDVKREFPEMKIIAVSGGGKVGPHNYLTFAKRLGSDAIFTKPVDMDLLLTAVKDLTEN